MFTLPIEMYYRWLGPVSTPSSCYVRIYYHADLGIMCIMTEHPENPGCSVTESIESLISSLIETFEGVLHHAHTVWIEHYPEGIAGDEHYDRVHYAPDAPPRWDPLDPILALQLQGVCAACPHTCEGGVRSDLCPGARIGTRRVGPKVERKTKAMYEHRLLNYWKGMSFMVLVLFISSLGDPILGFRPTPKAGPPSGRSWRRVPPEPSKGHLHPKG